ncbi:hypothetical protein Gbth_033_004 [Gluconobacter thailandicus F149-1 = NBRC 100600]|nr:hypothetical protein AD946_03500 [Gluconobacter thailandicus]GAN93826.1 hypothetical protein Gbth_033_004 [Gluconobacter thailandicus F149-1 = NBRC 100600]GEL88252.1 hypothetical protein GTH01_26100 [Gluconobacter thailandicus F149-1 = NBRC 100600]
MADRYEIDKATFRRGVTQSITELHITGGCRAVARVGHHWSWYPALHDGNLQYLAPQPIKQIGALATKVGLELFGGD